MCVASWRRALRTSMSGLLVQAIPLRQHPNAGSSGFDSLADTCPRGAANHVVAIERGLQRDGLKEVLLELLAELVQFVQRQIAEFAAFIETVANSVTDLFVGLAKWQTLVDEVRSGG